jgi:hypothetical protein
MPNERLKAVCPFANGPLLGLSLKPCRKTQEVDLFWHLYDTKLHGIRLSAKAIHKIIDLISSETIHTVRQLDLSPNEIYRVEKKKEEPPMVVKQEAQLPTTSG